MYHASGMMYAVLQIAYNVITNVKRKTTVYIFLDAGTLSCNSVKLSLVTHFVVI